MKIITSTDLKHWADTIECKNLIPLLIRKLILAGIKIENINRIDFPFGDDVQVGGYDGDLKTKEGNLYIPEGNSVWEFGVTESKKKEKANDDYAKRTAEPLGKIQSETTYIAVTLKKYTKKNDWANAKNKEGIWADVRFYDAIDIEHWLDLAPSVEIWLAEHLGKPIAGVQCADEYWQQWSTKEGFRFPYELLTESRPNQKNQLQECFIMEGGVLQFVKSNTKEESLAFILASIESLEENFRNSLHTKTLIVEDKESFRKLIQNRSPLILIPKFLTEDTDVNKAILKGHKIVVPESNSFSSNKENIISLPIVSHEVFINSLKQMGIDSEQAQLFSKNTGRDISVLRRSLDFSSKKPTWIDYDNTALFIPFLLVSRYDSSIEGDLEIISNVSKSEYHEYEKFLKSLLNKEESPIYNIGTKWRLISHSDSWLYTARFITSENLNKFEEIAIQVLSEVNPKYGLDPEKRYMASFYNARPKYSFYLKKGICETLIVLSVLAEKYELSAMRQPKLFVDSIVQRVLELADSTALRSLGYNLALLAEASPEVFITQFKQAIVDKRVLGFFEEEKDILSSHNELPNLLWALEGIAWMPEHLTNVVRVMCLLIQEQPDKLPTSNTPFNSLTSIFRLWFPQTNASMEERKQVLEILKKEYPDIAFRLFSSFVYSVSDVAFPAHKMRWRLFSETRSVSVTRQEVFHMHDYSVDSLIELTEVGDVPKSLVLIDKLDDINWNKIDNVLSCIDKFVDIDEKAKAQIYHAFRNLIGRHREHFDTDWSMPEEQLLMMEKTATLFEPSELILSRAYLFEEHHPEQIEGIPKEIKKDFDQQEKYFNDLRKEFVTQVVETYNIKKLIGLAIKSENPYMYGYALADTELSIEQEYEIIDLLKLKNEKGKRFLQSYIWKKERMNGSEKILVLFEKIKSLGKYSDDELAQFLLALDVNMELYEYIESLKNETIESVYWLNQNAYATREEKAAMFAIEKYAKFKRPISVLNALGRIKMFNKLPSDFIINTLDELDLSVSNDPKNVRVDSHFIREVFQDLQLRDGLDDDRLAKIEYKYLFIFDSLGTGVIPKNLYKAIAKDPNNFVAFIKDMYFPDDEDLKKQEIEKRNPEFRKQLGENAYKVLSNFNLIPGLQEDGTIIQEDLNSWIDDVRKLAIECHRGKVADIKIGELLARYPNGNKPIFFPKEIYDVIERLNNHNVNVGFRTQVFNRQSFSSRPAGSGGYIERDRASHFNSLAEEIKITHPNVSTIFRNIADSYEREGKRMDDDALQDSLD